MSKNLDAIANQKSINGKKVPVLDLREAFKKRPTVKLTSKTENIPDNPPNKEIIAEPEQKIKISSKFTVAKKNQPIWWTMEEKYSFNSLLSVIFFISAAIFLIISILQRNWIFMIILIIGVILFILYFLKPQKTIYRLTDEGFYIEETFYPFQQIKHFWIMETETKNFIIFETEKIFNKHLFLPFKKEKTEKIREFLNNLLKQKEIKPSLLDLISNIF